MDKSDDEAYIVPNPMTPNPAIVIDPETLHRLQEVREGLQDGRAPARRGENAPLHRWPARPAST